MASPSHFSADCLNSLNQPPIPPNVGGFFVAGDTPGPLAGSILYLFFSGLFISEFEKNITNIALPSGTWYNFCGLPGLVAMIYVSLISDIPEPQHTIAAVACDLSPPDNTEETARVTIYQRVRHQVTSCIQQSHIYLPH